MSDLSAHEVADMFTLIQKVERTLESIHETNSTTICIQDGPDAGQSVAHVHCHVIPRKATDFGGHTDQIYSQLATHDKTPTSGAKDPTKIRSKEDMTQEAIGLRKYF